MANTFLRKTASNISNNSGSPTTIYTCATNKTSIIIGCLLTNKTANEVTASVLLDTAISGDADAYLCFDLQLPPKSSAELSMGKVVLTHDNSNGDVIKAHASAASAVDVILSILEDVNG